MEEHGYTVIRALGQGGCQNRVYEVRNKEGRFRVVKQLPWVAETDRDIAMREVRLLSSLRHPCIVPYLESFLVRSTPSMPSEDILCLVMSRCERDLRQECLRLRLEWDLQQECLEQDWPEGLAANDSQGARFEEGHVLSWMAQLCWGLQHLHSRKFLHRDLKPQNVLTTHGGRRALLADFGVAGQVEHTNDLRRSIVGTPAFMSPEMLEGRPYGLKTDQWALGCVLFEMMALEPPFAKDCESYAAVVNAVLHAPPVSAPSGYSYDLSAVLEGLMARNPYERPSNRELLRGSLLCGYFHAFLQDLQESAVVQHGVPIGGVRAATSTAVGSAANAGSVPMIPATPFPQGGSVPGPKIVSHRSVPRSVSSSVPTLNHSPEVSESGSPMPRGWGLATTNNSRGSSLGGTMQGSSVGIVSGRNYDGNAFMFSGTSSRELVMEPDTVSYASDFETESVSAGSPVHVEQRSASRSAEESNSGSRFGSAPAFCVHPPEAQTNQRLATPPTWLGSEAPLSVRSGLDSSDSAPLDACAAEATTSMDGIVGAGLGPNEWLNLLAEAESLLRPCFEQGALAESRAARVTLDAHLGSARVDQALNFLRERRPLGETVEADELLLQVELLDLLGDEGLYMLPILERVLSLEATAFDVDDCQTVDG